MKDVKEIVKEKYGQIAKQSKARNAASCCGATSSCCDTEQIIEYSVMAEDYTHLKGYNEAADLGLGCGLPTQFAKIKEGDTVIDLGSGAGNDCFVARAETGEKGQVIGLDFTPAMVEKAQQNAKHLGFTNVKFIYGDIEDMPIDNEVADVVVSNCVLNLVPNKLKAFSETYRILKKGGHISVSDIVLEGDLPEGLRNDASMYAGCVASAIQMKEYLDIIEAVGFSSLEIQKKKPIILPIEILEKYLTSAEIEAFNKDQGIYSITVFAKK